MRDIVDLEYSHANDSSESSNVCKHENQTLGHSDSVGFDLTLTVHLNAE